MGVCPPCGRENKSSNEKKSCWQKGTSKAEASPPFLGYGWIRWVISSTFKGVPGSYRVSIHHPLGFNWHPFEGAGLFGCELSWLECSWKGWNYVGKIYKGICCVISHIIASKYSNTCWETSLFLTRRSFQNSRFNQLECDRFANKGKKKQLKLADLIHKSCKIFGQDLGRIL